MAPSNEIPVGPRRTLLATVTAAGVAQLPTAAIVVALPAIHNEFGTSLETLQWTVTAFLIPYAALMIAAGRAADCFGRRLVLVLGTAVFTIGSAVSAAAPDGPILIAGITIAGAGAAAMIPSSMSVITDVFRDSRRALAIGLWGGATEFVSGVGILMGGALTSGLGWRSIFIACAVIAVGIAYFALTATPESRDPAAPSRIDYLGAAVSAFFLAVLSLALIQGPSWGYTAMSTLTLFLLSAVSIGVFIAVELRAEYPIIEFGLLRRRNFAGSMVVIFALDFSLGALLFFLPLYFQEVESYSAIKTGLVLLPLTGLMVLGSPLGGRIAAAVGPRPPIVVGLALMAYGVVVLSRITVDTSLSQLWLPTSLIGFGTGLALTPMNLAAMNAVSRDKAGAAAGLLVTLSGLGATLGVAVTGSMFNELQARQTAADLHERGLPATESQARDLAGLLADTPAASAVIDKSLGLSAPEATTIVKEAFVSALASSMLISAGLIVVSIALTIGLMRREEPADNEIARSAGVSPVRPAPHV